MIRAAVESSSQRGDHEVFIRHGQVETAGTGTFKPATAVGSVSFIYVKGEIAVVETESASKDALCIIGGRCCGRQGLPKSRSGRCGP